MMMMMMMVWVVSEESIIFVLSHTVWFNSSLALISFNYFYSFWFFIVILNVTTTSFVILILYNYSFISLVLSLNWIEVQCRACSINCCCERLAVARQHVSCQSLVLQQVIPVPTINNNYIQAIKTQQWQTPRSKWCSSMKLDACFFLMLCSFLSPRTNIIPLGGQQQQQLLLFIAGPCLLCFSVFLQQKTQTS